MFLVADEGDPINNKLALETTVPENYNIYSHRNHIQDGFSIF